MTPQAFASRYTNPAGQLLTDNSGNYRGECVSLVKRFAQEAQAIPNADSVLFCQSTGGARDLYENPTASTLHFYSKVAPPFQNGDIIVWGSNMGRFGDTAVYLGNNQVIGQLGTPIFQPAQIRTMNPNPLGALRLKEVQMYPNQGDLVNIHNDTGWPGHTPNSNDVAFWCNGTGNGAWGNSSQVWKNLIYEVSTYVQQHPSTPPNAIKLTPGQIYQA